MGQSAIAVGKGGGVSGEVGYAVEQAVLVLIFNPSAGGVRNGGKMIARVLVPEHLVAVCIRPAGESAVFIEGMRHGEPTAAIGQDPAVDIILLPIVPPVGPAVNIAGPFDGFIIMAEKRTV